MVGSEQERESKKREGRFKVSRGRGEPQESGNAADNGWAGVRPRC
jgi:hypothetical protein